jgi:hypothetical protein
MTLPTLSMLEHVDYAEEVKRKKCGMSDSYGKWHLISLIKWDAVYRMRNNGD